MELQFTQTEIAHLFGCSAQIIRMCTQLYGLDDIVQYDCIDDDVLGGAVANFISNVLVRRP